MCACGCERALRCACVRVVWCVWVCVLRDLQVLLALWGETRAVSVCASVCMCVSVYACGGQGGGVRMWV